MDQYKCESCKQEFVEEKEFLSHLRSHSSEKNFSIPCPICPYRAKNFENYKYHKYKLHKATSDSSALETDHCPKSAKQLWICTFEGCKDKVEIENSIHLGKNIVKEVDRRCNIPV